MTSAPVFLPVPYGPIRHASRLAVGERIRLDASQTEALRFREIRETEAFTLNDSSGEFFRATLQSMRSRDGEALVYEKMPHAPESPLELTLLCAVPARQRMIQVVQKATELGVTRIVPVFTERSVGPDGLDHEKAHAWPKQVLRAARQCRRGSVPQLSPALPLPQVLAEDPWRNAEVRLFMDDQADTAPLPERGPASVALAVGPEGGWTDEEREQLRSASGTGLALGGRILRAETAVVAGLVLIQHRLGDLTEVR